MNLWYSESENNVSSNIGAIYRDKHDFLLKIVFAKNCLYDCTCN